MNEQTEGQEPAEPIETTMIADVGDLVKLSTKLRAAGRELMWWRGHARVEWTPASATHAWVRSYTPPRKRVVQSFILSGIVLLATCGTDSTGPRAVSGTYALESIDGQPVPYTWPPDFLFETLSGSLTLSEDLNCSNTYVSRTTDPQVGTVTADTRIYDCIYALNGQAITLTYSDGSVGTGSIAGSKLAIIFEDPGGGVGPVQVFVK